MQSNFIRSTQNTPDFMLTIYYFHTTWIQNGLESKATDWQLWIKNNKWIVKMLIYKRNRIWNICFCNIFPCSCINWLFIYILCTITPTTTQDRCYTVSHLLHVYGWISACTLSLMQHTLIPVFHSLP